MIEINMLPEELRKKEMPKLVLPDIPVAGVRIGIVVVVVTHLLFAGVVVLQQFELGFIKKDVLRLSVLAKEIVAQKSQMVIMQKRMQQIDALTARKFYWTHLLNGLTDSTIKGVWLNKFNLADRTDKGRSVRNRRETVKTKIPAPGSGLCRVLHLEGSAVSPGKETETIGKYIKELKQNTFFNDYFSELELVNINQRKIKEHDVYDFLIECRFKETKSGIV